MIEKKLDFTNINTSAELAKRFLECTTYAIFPPSNAKWYIPEKYLKITICIES